MISGLLGTLILLGAGALLIHRASIAVWAISAVSVLIILFQYLSLGIVAKTVSLAIVFFFILALIPPLRRQILSKYLFRLMKNASPDMSATEQEALEAGKVGWEGEIFSGSPDFSKLNQPLTALTKEEEAFIDGPVKQLCRMIDDWEITHELADMPPKMWEFIKKNKFFSMIIPKRFGGLEFSATAQMRILSLLYGRSITVASTIAVPNSLGPAELLLKYGTKAQQDYYLPRLAEGSEIPCFALTGPSAGSDAASIPDTGIVCKKIIDGKEVLGIKLNWNKRYITLAPVATLIGLAFRLFDPENLLGKGQEDIGITCALIPATLPGIEKGRRHFPLNNPFMNGPTVGKNVFIPMSFLIGNEQMVGQGWRMLMECLSAGRAITLPSSASGGAQSAALATGAYARIRTQFNLPIAKFEGIEEALARIAGKTYLISSALSVTVSEIDKGNKSAIAGAILKYHTTEWSRQIAMDAMDIHGGKGICLGPNNYLARGYEGAPIGITVEGANILTRNLIIFGQGAIRCHPYVLKELESIKNNHIEHFDKAIWGHISFFVSNILKTFLYAVTDARTIKFKSRYGRRYYQHIERYSCTLAFMTDFAMGILGGKLKRKEKISARLGDMLSYLYIASCVLTRFEQDGSLKEDEPLLDWSCQYLLSQVEIAMYGVIANFPSRWARVVLRIIAMPLGRHRAKPKDGLGRKLAQLLTVPNSSRSRLTELAFKEPLPNCPIGVLESALHQIVSTEMLEQRILKAVKEGRISELTVMDRINTAMELGVITNEEADRLIASEEARQRVIAVDDFSSHELGRATNDNDKEFKAQNNEKMAFELD